MSLFYLGIGLLKYAIWSFEHTDEFYYKCLPKKKKELYYELIIHILFVKVIWGHGEWEILVV